MRDVVQFFYFLMNFSLFGRRIGLNKGNSFVRNKIESRLDLSHRSDNMSSCIKAGILGGIVLFIWSAISWMVLPWHMTTMHNFKDQTAVSQIIQANAEQSGIYFSPSYKTPQEGDAKSEPMVFAAVHLPGMQPSMVEPMTISFLSQLVSAFLVVWLLSKTRGLSYSNRVGFILVFALAAGVVTDVPYWNWFKFDAQYTLVAMADLLIGWFFAGLVIAKFCDSNK